MDTNLAELTLSHETCLMIHELEQLDNASPQTIIERAVKAYWGQRIVDASNDAYSALRADPQAWQELQHERAAWDATLADGLDDS